MGKFENLRVLHGTVPGYSFFSLFVCLFVYCLGLGALEFLDIDIDIDMGKFTSILCLFELFVCWFRISRSRTSHRSGVGFNLNRSLARQ